MRPAATLRLIAPLLLFCLLPCQPAPAQSVSAHIRWYGVYTVKDTKEIDDPTSPTGKRFVSTPVAPDRDSDEIPARQIRFGMSYVLEGRKGSEVSIKQVYRFPPAGMPDVNMGGTRSTYERVRSATVGEPILMGWSFDGATREQMVPGEWIFEVWQGGRKILSQSFFVKRRD
jgi:hypothetical protein